MDSDLVIRWAILDTFMPFLMPGVKFMSVFSKLLDRPTDLYLYMSLFIYNKTDSVPTTHKPFLLFTQLCLFIVFKV